MDAKIVWSDVVLGVGEGKGEGEGRGVCRNVVVTVLVATSEVLAVTEDGETVLKKEIEDRYPTASNYTQS